MNINVRKTLLLVLLGVVVSGLSACNTIRGIGKDTEKAGEVIQEEAEEQGADQQPEQ